MQLSSRGRQMTRLSGIRSIMEDIAAAESDTRDVDWLNLSPGNPSHIPEVVSTWQRLTQKAVDERFTESSIRYGPSRGTSTFVNAIVDYFNHTYDWSITPENVVVGPGSQMLSFAATALFTGFDKNGQFRPLVLPRLPDYTGYQGLSLDPGGVVGIEPLIIENSPHSFRYEINTEALNRQTGMGMMLLSSPANPTGGSIDDAEMKALMETSERYCAPLVVDHAYGDPFPGVVPATVAPQMHPSRHQPIYLFQGWASGERIAFAIGPTELIDPVVSFIANSALHALS